MGNRSSKGSEGDGSQSLEAAKKQAEKDRRKSLKEKRKSNKAGKEWDPSGCSDQGPQINIDPVGSGDELSLKADRAEKKQRASIVSKSWDPSGTEEQGPQVQAANNTVGWKGHVAEDVAAEAQAGRRKSHMNRTSIVAAGGTVVGKDTTVLQRLSAVRTSLQPNQATQMQALREEKSACNLPLETPDVAVKATLSPETEMRKTSIVNVDQDDGHTAIRAKSGSDSPFLGAI